VAYTGTHDNDTTQGWWNTAGESVRTAVETLVGPVTEGGAGARPVWPLLRAVEGSVAQLAVVPVSDLLELDSSARMNTPSVGAGNWAWRLPEASLSSEIAQRLAALAELTDRDNDPLKEPEKS
jgi:4-alpha-glucanotransferase